ncbi:hypothetical protein NQ318_020304 [Aromia moschata]|uniref:CHK kinase-like domain-containing protein n=1 Tax=Aromia moschata TaxID=1265417 RepID=A0AAV8ZBS7_9CUCU|nr:hypothetical protein NQ318_020304 [Aromia moschata]
MEGSEVLSENQCKKIIERYAKTKDVTVKFYSVNLLKSQLDGLIGEQYIVKVHYLVNDEEKIAQFFLKTLNGSNPIMFDLAKSIYAYEKEAFYYETFTPLARSKGLDHDIAPKSYLCEPYVIVLEDLSLLSYRGTVKKQSLDIKHCRICLETLAKFHLRPILYEMAKSKELGKNYTLEDEFRTILEDKVVSREENGATKFMRNSIEGIFHLIELIPENGISRDDFREKLREVFDDIMASQGDSMGFRSTLLHGDLWSSNFLYRYEDNEIVDCKLIDFQTLTYGHPAMDILQFILTNTRKSFRNEHQNELITYYYDYMSELLVEKGLSVADVFPEDEFKKSCEISVLPAKIHAVIDRSITHISDETFLEASRTQEDFAKFLFHDRKKYIENSFNEDLYFKELMTEDVTELREMLFKRW